MKIKVTNLYKYFADTKAVNNVSFEFSSGDIIGFVGPNGAGKTTTMRLMSTLDIPTYGDIRIDGISVIDDPEKIRSLVGFMPDYLPSLSDTTIHDYLDFFARAFGVKGACRNEVLDGIEDFTGLLPIRDKLLKSLSKGMSQRVSLARALVHDPPVLILDEPAAGLDPRARIELWELLSLLAEQGKAILVSSHILTELADKCSSIIIIERGKLLKSGAMESLKKKDPGRKLFLRTIKEDDALARYLLEKPHIIDVKRAVNGVEIVIHGGDELTSDIIEMIIKDGFRLIEIKMVKESLEDIFMDITDGEIS